MLICAALVILLWSICSLSLRRHAHRTLAKRLMHMAHKSGNTSGVSKSSSDWLKYTGFLGDVCVAFFNVSPGNKDAVTPSPLMKEESRRVYNCDDEYLSVGVLRSGFLRPIADHRKQYLPIRSPIPIFLNPSFIMQNYL